jgi:aerobic-type carbon monoxide dehydrogenase small subunit (CoxS/CutS family)
MSPISRRDFLETGAAGILASASVRAIDLAPVDAASDTEIAVPRTSMRVTVNGHQREVDVEDRCTLAELLREQLALTGTKIGCDRGECGACTVLLNGAPVYSCSYLAVWTDGQGIETVEGLDRGGELHPLQEAFIEHDAPQCGFCTSGQLMSAKALLTRTSQPTRDEVRSALTGNLCRCANYNHYVDAVVAAGKRGAPRR